MVSEGEEGHQGGGGDWWIKKVQTPRGVSRFGPESRGGGKRIKPLGGGGGHTHRQVCFITPQPHQGGWVGGEKRERGRGSVRGWQKSMRQ